MNLNIHLLQPGRSVALPVCLGESTLSIFSLLAYLAKGEMGGGEEFIEKIAGKCKMQDFRYTV